jgi:hypothetical protein
MIAKPIMMMAAPSMAPLDMLSVAHRQYQPPLV